MQQPIAPYEPSADDTMGQTPYGRLALARMNAERPLPEDFQLYSSAWLGQHPNYENMKIMGAQFAAVIRGPRKGEMTRMVSGTVRTIYLTANDVRDAEKLLATAEATA